MNSSMNAVGQTVKTTVVNMSGRAFASIRARMTLAFAAAIAALMLSTCLLLTAYTRRAAEQAAQTLLQDAAQKFRQEFPGASALQDQAELRELESDFSDERLAFALRNAQGRVIASSPNASALLAVLSHPPARTNRREDWRTRTIAIGGPGGGGSAVIGFSWMQTRRDLEHQSQVLLAFSVLMGSVATFGAWLLVGRTLSPIGKLSQQARAVTEGDPIRLHPSSNDAEVVELVQTLNDLLARQQQANAARGRFYAAASHELRTPLQALSGHLELALQRPRRREEYLAVVEEAYVQTGRLTSLVRDLLRLHQLETVSCPSQESTDVGEVCVRALQSLRAVVERRGLILQADLHPNVLIASAPSHADMIARNLLENALLYSPEGSEVRVTLTDAPAGAVLEIRNLPDAAQITGDEDQPAKWLEAFYRPDHSRNGRTGGNGLGLAVCKAVADANGWQLSLRREEMFIVARVVFTGSRNSV